MRAFTGLLIAFVAVVAAAAAASDRWYTAAQVAAGAQLYVDNCAVCHGDRAEGQPGWQARDASGYYPAPPLDGSGHAADHRLADLLAVLETGTAARGGTMPSFSDLLTIDQRQSVVAYVQSLWADETYSRWSVLNAAGDGVGGGRETAHEH